MLTLIAVVPSLGARDLWNPDEPRYAEVARAMVATGDFLVPHLNGEIYAEKPPLVFWLAALLQSAGAGFVAGRLVTGAFAFGTLLLTGALAARWIDARARVPAMAVLATGFLFQILMRKGVLDVPLAFWTTLAVWAWTRGLDAVTDARGGAAPGGAARWNAILWVAAGLSVLTKGPVGLLHVALGVLGGALFLGRPAARRWGHAAWGVPLLLATVAAWVVPAAIAGGPEYRDTILLKQNVGRMADSWSHAQPWFYYLPRLFVNLFPWIFLALPAAVAARRPGARAATFWFVAGVAVFSLISGKREVYLLPLYPALAAVVGAWLAGLAERGATPRALTAAFRAAQLFWILVGTLPALVAVFGPRYAAGIDDPQDARIARGLLAAPELPLLVGFGALLAAAGLAAAWGAARLGPRAAGALLVVQMLGAGLVFDVVLTPAIDRSKSPRAPAERALALASAEPDSIATFPGNFSGAYNLYARRERLPLLETPAEVEAFLAGAPGRVVIASAAGLREIERAGGFPHRAEPVGVVGRREITLLRAP